MTLNIALLQHRTKVGDLEGNTLKLKKYYKDAINLQPDLGCLIAGELAISGYTPLDELNSKEFQQRLQQKIEELCLITKGNTCNLMFGDCQLESGVLYNVVYLIADGHIKNIIRKKKLVDYDVFSESRYFTPGEIDGPQVVSIPGVKSCGVLVCEEVWQPTIVANLAKQKPDFTIVVNASPYYVGKHEKRLKVLQGAAQKLKSPLCYLNIVCAVDGVVFDGNSCVFSKNGDLLYQGGMFIEQLVQLKLAVGGEQEAKVLLSTNIVNDVSLPKEYSLNAVYPFGIDAHGSSKEVKNESAGKDVGSYTCKELIHSSAVLQHMYEAMQLGFANFVEDNGIKGVVIGLSGGIDSTLSALLAADTLGAEKVFTVSLPSSFTSQLSKDLALEISNNLGVTLREISIESSFETIKNHAQINNLLEQQGTSFNQGNSLENLQSRLRANLLMMLSNLLPGYVVLSNGNKSELATGYFTIYGDSCGAYNIIKDLYKSEVYQIVEWRNKNKSRFSKVGLNLIPQAVIDRAPTAELAPGQTDEASLLPYRILDNILFDLIERRRPLQELYVMYNKEHLCFIYKLLKQAEHKRKQSPLGTKLKCVGFGQDWRYPVSNQFKLL